ncbi:MAG: transcription termination factor NusA [Mycoplasmatales bacterium]|nr:transcription termination factor NusA [Mycoplasmatales bacterium]
MEFNKKKFFEALSAIADQNLLTKEETKEIIRQSVFKTFHSKFDPDAELEMIIDEKSNRCELINHSKIVVENEDFKEEYRALEIPLKEALKIKKDAKEGDIISEEVDFATYAKQISNQIKQLITQSVREKKKEAVYAKHKSLKGEMVEATVTSSTKSYVIFELEDGTTAFMPSKLRNLYIPLSIGEKTKVFVEDVLQDSKESQIVVSNGSTTMVKRVLEEEVPEIHDGIIEIVNISRIAGLRSKIAVKSNVPEIDPIGSIIGASGSRINTIIKKLQGEKLDIIPWSEDINNFVINAIAPAKVISIFDKTDKNGNILDGMKIIITPNKHQTLAIGKFGSNVRLAVELTNIRIDVISYEQAITRGIDINWNGNVTEDNLASIERGERQKRERPQKSKAKTALKSDDLNLDMSSFAESIEIESSQKEKTINNSLELEDDMFSADELKKMEENFEFDSELSEFVTEEDFDEIQEYNQ